MKTYEFSGIATVSVRCRVEARSEREAWKMLSDGDCEWVCDEVDGDVSEVELTEES